MADLISVRSLGMNLPSSAIYFAFPDGSLNYDCGTCRSQCCRGHGYLMNGGDEFAAQVLGRPSLRLFLGDPAAIGSAPMLSVKNLPPGCFALSGDGLCSVQTALGFEAKPETCRLFPFNHFRFAAGHLIVAPHLSLCPLSVWDSHCSLSGHANLLGLLSSGVSSRVRRAWHLCESPADAITLEGKIRSLARPSTRWNRYEEFVKQQCDATRDTCMARAPDGACEAGTAEHLALFSSALRELLGAWPDESADTDSDILRLTLTTTPLIRSLVVFPAHDPSRDRWPLPLERVPYFMLALHKILGLARQAGMRGVNLQTVTAVFRSYRALLQLACLVDLPLRLAVDAQLDVAPHRGESLASYGRYIRVAKQLASTRVSPIGKVLASAVQDEQLGRLDILDALARRFIGQLVPVGTARMSYSLKRWVVVNVPESALLAMARRRMATEVVSRDGPPDAKADRDSA